MKAIALLWCTTERVKNDVPPKKKNYSTVDCGLSFLVTFLARTLVVWLSKGVSKDCTQIY